MPRGLSELPLQQHFSAKDGFVPQSTFDNDWRHLDVMGCYQHLMGRGQGCCQASPRVSQHITSAKVKISCPRPFQANHSAEFASGHGLSRLGNCRSAFLNIVYFLRVLHHRSQILAILLFISIVLDLLKGAYFGRKPELLYICLRTSILGQHPQEIFLSHEAYIQKQATAWQIGMTFTNCSEASWLSAVSTERKCLCFFCCCCLLLFLFYYSSHLIALYKYQHMAGRLEAKLFIGGCDVAILEVSCCMLWLNLF